MSFHVSVGLPSTIENLNVINFNQHNNKKLNSFWTDDIKYKLLMDVPAGQARVRGALIDTVEWKIRVFCACLPPCDQREELCLVHRGWQLYSLFFYAYFIRYPAFPHMEADEVRALIFYAFLSSFQ